MTSELRARRIAQRVLSAIAENRPPDYADVEALETFAWMRSYFPGDEIVNELVQEALHRGHEALAKRPVG